jgi:hypothetical protein
MIRSDAFTVALFLAALLIGPSPAFAQAAPFQTGEKICYNVKQFAVKVGDATLELKGDVYLEGKKYTLILFRADGFNFYDEERVFVDGATWLPQHVLRDLNIFGKKEQIAEDYFHQDGYVRVTNVSDGKTVVQRLNTKGPVDNIYGFIYRYRLGGKFDTGESFALQLPTTRVNLKFVEAMDFKAAGTTYKAVLLKSVPAKYSLWFDTGTKRLPLRIAGAVGMSNTVMTMVDCEK